MKGGAARSVPASGTDRATSFETAKKTARRGGGGWEGIRLGQRVLERANGGDRTRCLRAGKPALCHVSYVRGWMRPAGLEPAAFGAGNRRSVPLSYGRVYGEEGGEGGTPPVFE